MPDKTQNSIIYKYLIIFATIVLVLLVVLKIYQPSYNNDMVNVKSVKEAGLIENPNRKGFVRDGGSGAAVGNKYFWLFGDTLFNPKSVDGSNGRSNTAGWADIESPTKVNEALDKNKAPYQFIPFSESDSAYNKKTAAGDDRYAIWPGPVMETNNSKDKLLIYFYRLKVNPGNLNYDLLNTGIATANPGDKHANIKVEKLFEKPAPTFTNSGFVHDGHVYLYNCLAKDQTSCSIARVKQNAVFDRSEYRFWDGSAWQESIEQASEQFYGSTTGTGIGWNNDLKRFVIVYSEAFTGDIYLTTSENLTDGWSSPEKIYTAKGEIYATNYHPGLSSQGELALTYYQPNIKHEQGLHLVKIKY